MIYFVTRQEKLFESELYKVITPEESLKMMAPWGVVQYDSETTGKDCHIAKLLTMQFGNKKADIQIVVDCTTVDPLVYKGILEQKFLIGHNLKFDFEFLYNYGIVPRRLWDTMIAEQFLYLGFAHMIRYSLQDVARRYLGEYMDKTVRGEIIWRGIDDRVVEYAATDVMYLEDIMWLQVEKCKKRNAMKGVKIECDAVPFMAYMEWCGIKLDVEKWKEKMRRDKENFEKAKDAINQFIIRKSEEFPKLQKYVYVDRQGDLFNGFDLSPKCNVNWNSPVQMVEIAQILGFNTETKDKKTGDTKDAAGEKLLVQQRSVCPEFLDLLFGCDKIIDGNKTHVWGVKEAGKVCSSFGQGHIDYINPNTGRIHTVYRQIGTKSGRMSSGNSIEPNPELAKLKGIQPSRCKAPNFQQLPHDKLTRSCFVAEQGNIFISCDYSGMEARIGADVYNEKVLLDEYLHGSGDSHAAYAKVVFAKELEGIEVKDIKKLRPDLRNKVKSVEFATQFGSDGTAVAGQLGISVEEARQLVQNLLKGMKGLAEFKRQGSRFVRKYGYVDSCTNTGHRCYWPDFRRWVEAGKPEGKEASYYDRLALNFPTQGGGAVCLKRAVNHIFNWVIDNGYFGKILLVNLTHDESNWEAPKELEDTFPKLVSDYMEQAAAEFYHKLPIPAEASVGSCWIH